MDPFKVTKKERAERLLNSVRYVRAGKFKIRPLTLPEYLPELPPAAKEGLLNYALTGCPPGGFLGKVLANDLTGSVIKADLVNLRGLAAIAAFMHERLPRECWGSKKVVAEWIAAHETARKAEKSSKEA